MKQRCAGDADVRGGIVPAPFQDNISDLPRGQRAIVQACHDHHVGAGLFDVGHDIFPGGLRGRTGAGLTRFQGGGVVIQLKTQRGHAAGDIPFQQDGNGHLVPLDDGLADPQCARDRRRRHEQKHP